MESCWTGAACTGCPRCRCAGPSRRTMSAGACGSGTSRRWGPGWRYAPRHSPGTWCELTLRHHYVLLDLPYGGEELARQLRREYGVSLMLSPSKEQLEAADAMVCFDPRPDCLGPGRIPLYDGASPMPPLSLPPALEEQLPAGVRRDQQLTVLREAGSLRPGQLSVGT